MDVLQLPSNQWARVILDANELRKPTQQYSTDATTALTRGLAQYVAQLELAGVPAFKACYDAWAESEDEAAWPAFVAYTNENDGSYEEATLAASVSPVRYPNGQYEVSSSALAVDVKCEIRATNNEQRQVLAGLLEQAFAPVEWMDGFRLELPHYYGQRATYMPSRITYLGGATEAQARYVLARMTVRAAVPVTRLLPFAMGQPRVRVNQVGTSELQPPLQATNVIRGNR